MKICDKCKGAEEVRGFEFMMEAEDGERMHSKTYDLCKGDRKRICIMVREFIEGKES